MNVTNLFDKRFPREKICEISSFDLMTSKERTLDAQTLTTLCTPPCENSPTTLRGHTSTESMALSAFALVRLIRTLHRSILLLEIEASVRNYRPVRVLVNDDSVEYTLLVVLA